MLIFFYLLILISETSEYINLSFKTREIDLKNLSPTEFYQNYFTNDIYTTLKLGTPLKEIEFSLKSNIYPISITSHEFREGSKSFFTSDNKYYPVMNSGFKNGLKANDIFKINNETLNNFEFYYSNDTNSNKGIIGLTLLIKPIIESGFIYQLKKRNIIDSYYFFIEYDKNYNNGNLILGALPHQYNSKYKEDNYASISLNSYSNYFELNFNTIFYGNDFVVENEIIQLFYDYNFIRAGNKFKLTVLEKFFNKYIEDNKCFSEIFNKEMISYYCNKDVPIKEFNDLKFFHKEFNFTFILNYNDLFKEVNGKYYFLMYFKKEGTFTFQLGKPFLKKYLMIFNQDKRTIGFYKSIENNNNSFFIWILIFFDFLIILLLGGYILIFKPGKFRKKRINEIEEEYEYTVQKI